MAEASYRVTDVKSALLKLRLQDLLLFVYLFEDKKLSNAARRMNLSVPTAERKLNALREAIADPLFTRGAFMVPTGRAQELYPEIRALLKGYLSAVEPHVFDPQTVTRNFKLGINSHGIFFIPKNFFRYFLDNLPKASLEIVRPSSDICELLSSGAVDCAIIRNPEMADSSVFHHREIYRGKRVIVVRKGHPLEKIALERPLTVDDLNLFNHVRLFAKARTHLPTSKLDVIGQSGSLISEARVTTPFFIQGIVAVIDSNLICICPYGVAELWERAQLVTCIDANFLNDEFSLYLLWHERTQAMPEYQYFRSLLLGKGDS